MSRSINIILATLFFFSFSLQAGAGLLSDCGMNCGNCLPQINSHGCCDDMDSMVASHEHDKQKSCQGIKACHLNKDIPPQEIIVSALTIVSHVPTLAIEFISLTPQTVTPLQKYQKVTPSPALHIINCSFLI